MYRWWINPPHRPAGKGLRLMSSETHSRREVLAGSAAAAATILTSGLCASAEENNMNKTFTILHTNDMHSGFIGMGPAVGLHPVQAQRRHDPRRVRASGRLDCASGKRAREDQGPVLVLDAGDYSMGTAFGAARRETGGELQLMSRMGYDATTFGNHEFDFGPDGLGKSMSVAAKAGRFPAVVASNTSFAGTDATLADLQRLTKEGVIRRHLVIERGGIRFGIFGVLGKEAQILHQWRGGYLRRRLSRPPRRW